MNDRERLKDKKRIVIKIGSSSLTHAETGKLNLRKLEILVRELGDLRNQGKDVVLVSSGAIAVGAAALGFKEKPQEASSEAGVCSGWTGQTYDDLPEAVWRIQSDGRSDPDDQKYHGKQRQPQKCREHV